MSEPLLKAPEAMALLQVKSSKFYQMQSRGLVTLPDTHLLTIRKLVAADNQTQFNHVR